MGAFETNVGVSGVFVRSGFIGKLAASDSDLECLVSVYLARAPQTLAEVEAEAGDSAVEETPANDEEHPPE